MKIYQIPIFIAIVSFVASCSKDQIASGGKNTGTTPERKVRYELYTNENFAGNQENIQFSIFIRNAGNTIFDSSLAAMKIRDIPDSIHRIIIEKIVPGNDGSALTVGFDYQIENVGESWYLENFPEGDTLKVIKYPFR